MRTVALLAGAVSLTLLAAACRAPMPGAERAWRSDRESAIGRAVPAGTGFAGLRFYPYDPDYRLKAMIEPVSPPEPLKMAASDGSVRPAHKVGKVSLSFPDGAATLSLYQLDDVASRYPDYLFLPFRDAGSGTETYGAGRYVEIEKLPGGVVEIDFNRAYNPDCAYGITAQCPITPPENTLPFKVEAGEMLPPGH